MYEENINILQNVPHCVICHRLKSNISCDEPLNQCSLPRFLLFVICGKCDNTNQSYFSCTTDKQELISNMCHIFCFIRVAKKLQMKVLEKHES